MLLPILKYGAIELKTSSSPVDSFNGELEKIAKNMIETMYAAPGIGLAAPQIGLNIRLATIDLSVGEDPSQVLIICNPEILSTEGEQKCDEGCLSVPGWVGDVMRHEAIVVRGLNRSPLAERRSREQGGRNADGGR